MVANFICDSRFCHLLAHLGFSKGQKWQRAAAVQDALRGLTLVSVCNALAGVTPALPGFGNKIGNRDSEYQRDSCIRKKMVGAVREWRIFVVRRYRVKFIKIYD